MVEPHRVRLTLLDVMTIVFIVFNASFILVNLATIEQPWSLITGYGVCLSLTLVVVAIGYREPASSGAKPSVRVTLWLWGFVREAYPIALIGYFFVSVTAFDTAIVRDNLDPFFRQLDTAVFGSVPSSWLMTRFDSFFLSELLHGAYVLYYLSIPALALWLYVNDRKALREFMVVALFLFYVTNVTYLFLPVVGGRFDPVTKALAEAYRHGAFTRIMALIYRNTGHMGAAFPSTHVIIGTVIALQARKHAKPLAPVLSINALLVLLATVYCGYHYVADLAGALVYVAVFYPLGLALYRRYGDKEIVKD